MEIPDVIFGWAKAKEAVLKIVDETRKIQLVFSESEPSPSEIVKLVVVLRAKSQLVSMAYTYTQTYRTLLEALAKDQESILDRNTALAMANDPYVRSGTDSEARKARAKAKGSESIKDSLPAIRTCLIEVLELDRELYLELQELIAARKDVELIVSAKRLDLKLSL